MREKLVISYNWSIGFKSISKYTRPNTNYIIVFGENFLHFSNNTVHFYFLIGYRYNIYGMSNSKLYADNK